MTTRSTQAICYSGCAFIVLFLVLSPLRSVSAESKVPAIIGKLPEQSDGATQFGIRKHGIRIGFSQPKESYRLNHRINIWIMYETAGPLPKGYHLGEDIVTLTHPDGSVSKFPGDSRIDVMGGPEMTWFGGMSDQLHYYCRTTGVYKMQWKLGDIESAVISWRVVP